VGAASPATPMARSATAMIRHPRQETEACISP
jgi:hypothetical protein